FIAIVSIINDGHYFPRIRGIPIDGLNEPLTFQKTIARNVKSCLHSIAGAMLPTVIVNIVGTINEFKPRVFLVRDSTSLFRFCRISRESASKDEYDYFLCSELIEKFGG
ncbi:hypothetical protein KKJ25_22510, partial [Xenorhabdus bovienii]|uniref:hypothetical protein n=1 Tax=Xenorhabdus bovienii TaxID=40576 RepID=UPI00237CB1CB